MKVFPNLAEITRVELMLRRNRHLEMGLRRTRNRGAGSEFESLRDYTPDDEFRCIDWKATARRSKPITMAYETERSQTLIALLDIGRLMRSPVGELSKMDHAINAVLLLAHMATRQGDKIGLLSFADEVENWLPPRGGKRQFHAMLEQLYAIQGQSVESDFGRAFQHLSLQQGRRALVLIFTDLAVDSGQNFEDLILQIQRLRRRHLPLLISIADPDIHALAQQEASSSQALFERTTAAKFLENRRLALERLERSGVLTLDVPADELSLSLIERYLEIKSRGWR